MSLGGILSGTILGVSVEKVPRRPSTPITPHFAGGSYRWPRMGTDCSTVFAADPPRPMAAGSEVSSDGWTSSMNWWRREAWSPFGGGPIVSGASSSKLARIVDLDDRGKSAGLGTPGEPGVRHRPLPGPCAASRPATGVLAAVALSLAGGTETRRHDARGTTSVRPTGRMPSNKGVVLTKGSGSDKGVWF